MRPLFMHVIWYPQQVQDAVNIGISVKQKLLAAFPDIMVCAKMNILRRKTKRLAGRLYAILCTHSCQKEGI